jgi:glycyl-tRNA synthetase beta chain
MTTGNNLPLLLEIGTEEIPARFLPIAIADLKTLAASVFDEYRIGYQEIQAYATPRRLALIINDVPPMQRDNVKEVFGPSRKIAFDDNGNHTKAAIGFAGSLGINPSALSIKKKGTAEYVAAIIEEKGIETKSVLPDALKKILLSLRFPKSMRWGNGHMLFVRPIHWIAAVLGSDTLSFEIEGIKSGNMTRGHRFLSPASFQIKEASSYMNMLENNFVVLDNERRKKLIRDGIISLSVNANGHPVIDEGLLDTVTYLVEYPVPVLCGFSEEYLKLPKELLITVMKDHQKYFAVQNSNGNLLNKFIVISNTRAENAETVRIGAERVIRARFDDAKFYFHENKKKTLSERIEDLGKVTFHDKLGSLFDKTERVVSIASFLSEKTYPDLREKLIKAVRLSKTDLITGVVREFPELQGIMGKYYAGHDGEERKVAIALEEQYLPASFGGRLPETEIGALLSLSDKIDNLTSFFSIGLIPTGSEDPFALRRQAMGIASIIMARGYAITLEEIFKNALQNLSKIKVRERTLENITGFMEQRVEYILTSMGYEQELVKSVISQVPTSPLKTITGRLDALRKFKQEGVFPEFLLAIKRVNNIIPKTPLPLIRPDLLAQDEEKTLYDSFMSLRDRIGPLASEGNFTDFLMIFAEITAPVNNFFDKVLVMDKNEDIKANRLSLLKEIWTTALMAADFSKLQ